ncbi:MAG: 4-(cytidine 5'-diphospho)-2-C-methyl-D-erythritol kinase [Planctomycetota bacterium]|nr:4-(cytidine 5'-diphospho)-2-C-methyl-D-erythritol kinase [Planctomycetota bacterium]
MRTIRLRAHAKLNLFLEVVGLRPDGFHELRTVMHEIDLADDVKVSVSHSGAAGDVEKPAVVCRWAGARKRPSSAGLPSGTDNIAYRAAELFLVKMRGSKRAGGRSALASAKRSLGLPARGGHAKIAIEILKRIPLASGMGGGSSDAAAVLVALNRLFGSPLGPASLARLAASVGSDVPFFLKGGTALCTGRGEKVKPLKPPATLHFVLLVPPWGIATADVYRTWDRLAATESRSGAVRDSVPSVAPDKGSIQDLTPMSCGGVDHVGVGMSNALEPPAFLVKPRMRRLKGRMEGIGFVRVMMTGSGSTLFGLCKDRRHAAACSGRLKRLGIGRVILARSAPPIPRGQTDHRRH